MILENYKTLPQNQKGREAGHGVEKPVTKCSVICKAAISKLHRSHWVLYSTESLTLPQRSYFQGRITKYCCNISQSKNQQNEIPVSPALSMTASHISNSVFVKEKRQLKISATYFKSHGFHWQPEDEQRTYTQSSHFSLQAGTVLSEYLAFLQCLNLAAGLWQAHMCTS